VQQVDNSNHDVKRALREEYMAKVGARLCFDLFCGHGTYCRELYRDHFEQVVCVDQKADALADVPGDAHVKAYKGNNAGLVLGLVNKYGFADFWDLDAYGNPEAALVKGLKMRPALDRFAVVGTDGTFISRKRNCSVPVHWGYGKEVRWAPFAAGRKDYPVIVRDNLSRWFADAGYALAEFEAHLPRRQSVIYWAALATRQPIGAPFQAGE